MYITDIKGNPIKVTNLPASLAQAEHCVQMHVERQIAHEKDKSIIYYKQAHIEWNHILQQLQTLIHG